jgi:hypothetical protein
MAFGKTEPAMGAGGVGTSAARAFRFLEDFEDIRPGTRRPPPSGFGPNSRYAAKHSENSHQKSKDRPEGAVRLIADFHAVGTGGKPKILRRELKSRFTTNSKDSYLKTP